MWFAMTDALLQQEQHKQQLGLAKKVSPPVDLPLPHPTVQCAAADVTCDGPSYTTAVDGIANSHPSSQECLHC